MKWIPIEHALPKIGEYVLCYYTIDDFEYYVVGRIDSITTQQTSETRAFQSIDWNDDNHNPITPTHWTALTPPATAKQ